MCCLSYVEHFSRMFASFEAVEIYWAYSFSSLNFPMWVVVMPCPCLILHHILVSVMSIEHAPLCLWMCVSHHHVRINVARALCVVYHILSISAKYLSSGAFSLYSLSFPMWVVVMPFPYLFLLYILVTVLSFVQAHLCLWMCVSHDHVRINVTRAFSSF